MISSLNLPGKGRFLWATLAVLIYVALASFTSANAVPVQENPQEMFNRGNYFLEQANFHDALEIYRKIEQNNFSSGPLYLNMAISYVHLDSLGLAKYYFLKAGKHSATREKSEEGVALIDNRLNQQRGSMPSLSWIAFYDWLHFELNTFWVIISGLALLNAGLLLIALGWHISTFQRAIKTAGTSASVLGLIIILAVITIDTRTEDYSRAVMVETQTTMRPHPTDSTEVISMIYEGYTFTLDQTRSRKYDGWKFVRLSNGLNGWVEDEAIREL